jgi:hypothetical protein
VDELDQGKAMEKFLWQSFNPVCLVLGGCRGWLIWGVK